MPIFDEEKSIYNDHLSEQAKAMINNIHKEQKPIRIELKSLRESNKGVEDKAQRRQNMLATMRMSENLMSLHKKEELIMEEMCRLEMVIMITTWYEPSIKNETIPIDFEPYFYAPPTFKRLKRKENNGEEITHDEKYQYDDSLG